MKKLSPPMLMLKGDRLKSLPSRCYSKILPNSQRLRTEEDMAQSVHVVSCQLSCMVLVAPANAVPTLMKTPRIANQLCSGSTGGGGHLATEFISLQIQRIDSGHWIHHTLAHRPFRRLICHLRLSSDNAGSLPDHHIHFGSIVDAYPTIPIPSIESCCPSTIISCDVSMNTHQLY